MRNSFKHHIETAKSELYEIIVEVKSSVKNGNENSLITGIITIKDKKGNTFTKIFYGECRC